MNSPGAPPHALRLAIPGVKDDIRRFVRARSFVMFDWRGTGGSDRPDGAIATDDLVADLEAVMAAIGEPVDARFMARACVPGCLHAARYPQRYRSIEIMNGYVRFAGSWQGIFNRPGWQGNYREHLMGALRHFFEVSPSEALAIAGRYERGVPQRIFEEYLDAEREIDLSEILPLVDVPVLVTAYQVIDYEPAAALAALLPNARLVISPPPDGEAERQTAARDTWDDHLGSRLGDPPSRSVQSGGEGLPWDLTRREQEVLALLVESCSNAEIAAALTLSTRTVEFHLANVYQKLGVHSRVAAANAARARGIV